VNSDYVKHIRRTCFLAESFDVLRDPKLINLRYENAGFSELLHGQPAGAGVRRDVSRQRFAAEYPRASSTRDHVRVFPSDTEYTSRGNWRPAGVAVRNPGPDQLTRWTRFNRTRTTPDPNNNLEQLNLALRVKQQLTEKDGLFFEVSYFNSESGDVAQYLRPGFRQQDPARDGGATSQRTPGLPSQWSPHSHTLALVSRSTTRSTSRMPAPKLIATPSF
jgi:hypothetical protein